MPLPLEMCDCLDQVIRDIILIPLVEVVIPLKDNKYFNTLTNCDLVMSYHICKYLRNFTQTGGSGSLQSLSSTSDVFDMILCMSNIIKLIANYNTFV
jgi:hypothetical protein